MSKEIAKEKEEKMHTLANKISARERETAPKYYYKVFEKYYYKVFEKPYYKVFEKYYYKVFEKYYYKVFEKHYYKVFEKYYYKVFLLSSNHYNLVTRFGEYLFVQIFSLTTMPYNIFTCLH